MKSQAVKILILLIIIAFVISPRDCVSQVYTLSLTNDQQIDSKNYEFDIYLLKAATGTFEYANNSQYFININPSIINGGSLSFTILSGTCDLNVLQQIPPSKVSFDNVNNRLRIASSSPSGAGTGTIISAVAPGVRLGRFRVTNTVTFAAAQSNLTWYNFHSGFFTKVFAYVSGVNTEITDSTKHLVNINNIPLPVTLYSFTSTSIKNNIKLSWVTHSELNNKGFAIERNSAADTNWDHIGFINGAGSSNEVVMYTFMDNGLNTGTYKYRLKQIDYNGNITIFNLAGSVIIGIPASFTVSQNYPNPSNPKSRIDYQMPENGIVTIKVYDMLGREIATLVNEMKQAGYYSAEFDGSNLSSGIYIYIIQANSFKSTKKMVLIK